MPELPQPNAESKANLDKIEVKTGERWKQIPIKNIIEWESRYGYSCDKAGNVTGLNLRDTKIADISFLTDFPRFNHLVFKRL